MLTASALTETIRVRVTRDRTITATGNRMGERSVSADASQGEPRRCRELTAHTHPICEDAWPLTCPVCDSDLSRGGGVLSCRHGHSFDVARDGYVNLLPAQHRQRGMEGDTADMVRARRRFLDEGHYGLLRDALTAKIADVLTERTATDTQQKRRTCIAEVGCGEGYYLGGVADDLPSGLRCGVAFVGTDLSKSAVKLAAKRHPDLTLFVADVHRKLCMRTGSVSVLLDVFSPRNSDEFARVLEPEGHLLVVIPSQRHLGSLRSALGLIGIQQDKERRVVDQFSDRFSLVDRAQLQFSMELSPDAVTDLVEMGPNHWHERKQGEERDQGTISTEASFVLLHFQRDERVHPTG